MQGVLVSFRRCDASLPATMPSMTVKRKAGLLVAVLLAAYVVRAGVVFVRHYQKATKKLADAGRRW